MKISEFRNIIIQIDQIELQRFYPLSHHLLRAREVCLGIFLL